MAQINEAQINSFLISEQPWLDTTPTVNSRLTDESFVLLPGSFNPLHSGHVEMAHQAQKATGLPVLFELSIENADKGILSVDQILTRLSQRFAPHRILLTKAPTFELKAKLFPLAMFAVGADTIIRIGAKRFYRNEAHRQSVFQLFRDQSQRFLVFGRDSGKGFEHGIQNLPPTLKDQCVFVPQSEFESPLSSTELRNRSKDH